MTVYFDLENLVSFLKLAKAEETRDTYRSVLSHLNIGFNFSKDEVKQMSADRDTVSQFLNQMNSGRNNLVHDFLKDKFPARPITANFKAHAPAPLPLGSIALINDENLSACKAAGNAFIGGVGEELDILKQLRRPDDFKFQKDVLVGSPEFSNWSQLTPDVLPFHDLIISDRYFLRSDPDTFEHNYRGLLTALLTGKRTKVSIVILALKPKQPTRPDHPAPWVFEDYEAVTCSIAERLTVHAPDFTLVWADNEKELPHGRNIITNYQWFNSGDSFMYFWPNGQLRGQGDKLSISSLADRENRQLAQKVLIQLQEKLTPLLAKPGAVLGNGVSSYLRFE
ncbi:hypothetical protein MUN84_18655 [Hymenobacter sp. 5516J-16]|uniref:hypothetical protein n=1 Tax=Hymenobacter sp. 5516J-16 TaxID=2932253 RepID=UPI001FD0174F|nr:hypothetical protein [Hymenobacter sp. 5516J-16]UOQ76535.1 hypothetical protein MUN84_18655 [Hymenobacter sp. 5516J-16]